MAVLTADTTVSTYGTPTKIALLSGATDIFYKGSIVFSLAAGGVTPAGVATSKIIGICAEQVSATSGTTEVEVYVAGFFEMLLGTNIAAADEGDFIGMDAAGITDNPADLVSFGDGTIGGDITAAQNDSILGRVIRAKTATMIVAVNAGGITGFISPATGVAAAWM